MGGSDPIMVVDDEIEAARYMALALEERFKPVRMVVSAVEALLAMERELPAVVLSDLKMPGMDGMELLTLIRERWPQVAVILITVERDVGIVVEAIKKGAVNYLVKPSSPEALRQAVSRALVTRIHPRTASCAEVSEFVGVSAAALRIRHQVSLAARADVNVLITGETGTGKELVARAIHRLSSLARGPFVPHNCAMTSTDLLESEFFGHLRGAFTGADRDQKGLLEAADDGILFLDELECFPLLSQAKLLRVQDSGEFRPVGAQQTRRVCVRFLAATNRSPAKLLRDGLLREDLYFRLRGIEIELPPLRQHPDDIPVLAENFLQGTGAVLDPEALRALQEFSWPGNVRQLRSVLQASLPLAHGGLLRRSHLRLDRQERALLWVEPPPRATTLVSVAPEGGVLQDAEKRLILQALVESRGNRSRAAEALGIHRSTLRRKMREFGLWPDAGTDRGLRPHS
jgi:DNA-binding NtrC family response regulator